MLKSLELFGFKSFADRTRFDFHTGITCVVGPNGSGKSNVVDAMKWILGDQSAKSLRGKEMTDVIFNGAAGRKAASFAEATLTFDNASGWLSIDTQEVQVGRRIWRNGDAEYLINRAPARLKDVRDLLLGTGAGSAAYSIIEQGRVDQILQANPLSRRIVFEEAAGISRFRARQQDAQRKLERVAQNLLRLTDIVDEVEAQLNATRSQAAKAAKYRELSQDLKRWWLGLAADDFHHFHAELKTSETELGDVASQLTGLNLQQQELEQQERAFDHEITQLDDQLRAVDRQGAGVREATAGFEVTIQHQQQRLVELEADVARLQRQQLSLITRSSETRGEIADAERQLLEFERDYELTQSQTQSRLSEVVAISAQVAFQRESIERDRARVRDLTKAVSTAQSQQLTSHSRLTTIEESRLRHEQQLVQLNDQLALRVEECERCREALAVAQQGLLQAQKGLKGVHSRRRKLEDGQTAVRERLSSLKEQRSATLARRSLLEDLEQRQEGLGIGVREILQRAKLADQAPWNSIIGTLTDLLDVDLDNAALLEVALGNRAQLIVVREYQPLIDYLNQGLSTISGRVGFLAIPDRGPNDATPPAMLRKRWLHLPVDAAALPDLSRIKGVVTRADGLVSSERGTHGLAEAVLADTWIVQDLDVALNLSQNQGRGCRFVTLQGEVLEHNGTLIVGTLKSDTAVLPRKSELRMLKNELIRIDQEIVAEEAALHSTFTTLSGADQELELAATQVDRAAAEFAAKKAELVAADQHVERLQHEQAEIQSRLEALESELESIRNAAAQARQQAEQAEQSLLDVEAALKEAELELQQFEQHASGLEKQQTAEQLNLAKQEERLQSLRIQLRRLQDELRQREVQREECARRYEGALAKRSQITLHLLNTNAIWSEQLIQREVFSEESTRLLARKTELRKRRTRIVEAELDLRKQRREIGEMQHQLEMRIREVRHTLAALAQRLEEEDQQRLEEVAASGVSAYRLYLEERKHGSHRDADAEAGATLNSGQASIQHSGTTIHGEDAAPSFAEIRPELEARVARLRRKLKMLGNVNTDSLEALEEVEQRYQTMHAQLQDLVEAKTTLEEIIRRINLESKRLFTETFDIIRANFQELFRKVFGGGEGDIVVEDPDDILECGIDIKARPPGKELRSISLLSGGEKTMTAIALIMAIFKAKPSPFCILDEVDAALDEANVERFTGVIQEFRHSTQFIMITHHKRSMVVADLLYGVTMEESGVSKRMSVRFDDVTESGEFRTRPTEQAA